MNDIKTIIPIQKCYPYEYKNYQLLSKHLMGCKFPVEFFKISFSKDVDMVMYPNACSLLSFELKNNKEVEICYIGRITETVSCHRDKNTLYYFIKFPPQFIFKSIAGTVNQNIDLGVEMFGGTAVLTDILNNDNLEKQLNSLIKLVQQSEMCFEVNELIDHFTYKSFLSSNNSLVEEIVREINYSARHARTVIKENTGISSKRLFDIMRLQNIIDTYILIDGDIQNCVYDKGFYDQTHLNKNIRKLTGLNYSTLKEIIKAKNVEQSNL